ncbi:MAG: serine hydrolase domain-containing protein [Flavobacteriaceae bacterium]
MQTKYTATPRSILILIFYLFTSITFAQSLEKVAPEAVGFSSERLAILTKTLQNYVAQEKLPGAVALVLRNGKVAYWEAVGQRDVEQGAPLQKNSIFRIASQTKALVSVGIMILQEEGKLLISDAVGKYIPEFNETTVAEPTEDGYRVVPAKRKITLRDLLTHTAGIDYGNGTAKEAWKAAGIQGWYFADRNEPVLATIKRIGSLPQQAQPGTAFVYGYNTDILGAVIEVVSGQTLSEFITARILKPLGMNDTHFYLPKAKANRLAVVYSSKDGGIERAADPGKMVGQGAYVNGPRKSFSGGAGLLSTAEDYATFLQMMLNKGTYKNQRILSRKSVDLMTQNHLGDIVFPWTPGMGFGLGFSTVEDVGLRGELGSHGEFGWGGAYHSTYWVDPAEQLVVVYFTQLIPAENVDDHQKLRTLIYQALN